MSPPSTWALERANALKGGSDNYAWVTTREVAAALDAAREEGVAAERQRIVADLQARAADGAKYPKGLGAAIRGSLLGLAQRYANGE